MRSSCASRTSTVATGARAFRQSSAATWSCSRPTGHAACGLEQVVAGLPLAAQYYVAALRPAG